MTTPPDLSGLLHEAVADVEPAERIDALRSRVADAPARAARPWWYAAGGVVLATAAALTAFAVIDGSQSGDPHLAHEGHGEHGENEREATVVPGDSYLLVAAYYLGDTERGPRLFREFVPVEEPADRLQAALDRIQRPAQDPDYSTQWPDGSFESASVGKDAIQVEVGTVDVDQPDPELSLQQLVYTMQAAAQRQLPVQLVQDGEAVGGPIDAEPMDSVLNHVSVSDPVEGTAYDTGAFFARGRAYTFEATVGWEIRDKDGEVVLEYSTMTADSTRFSAWETRIDISELAPGTYTFEARTDDPNPEPPGPDTDTRTIIVR